MYYMVWSGREKIHRSISIWSMSWWKQIPIPDSMSNEDILFAISEWWNPTYYSIRPSAVVGSEHYTVCSSIPKHKIVSFDLHFHDAIDSANSSIEEMFAKRWLCHSALTPLSSDEMRKNRQRKRKKKNKKPLKSKYEINMIRINAKCVWFALLLVTFTHILFWNLFRIFHNRTEPSAM